MTKTSIYIWFIIHLVLAKWSLIFVGPYSHVQNSHETFGPCQNVLDIWSSPEPFDMDKICPWTFWTGTNGPANLMTVLLFLFVVLVTKSCLTLGDPMDCSQPGSSVYGISQAKILQWVAISFTRGSTRPRD